MQSSKLEVCDSERGIPFCQQLKVFNMKGVPLLPRIVYTRRPRAWTFGWSLTVFNFFEYLSVYYHHKLLPYHILV